MRTLQVTVTKSYRTNFEPIVDSWSKSFAGKTADKDCQTYLEQLHFEKMNQACINAGVGNYTLARITKPLDSCTGGFRQPNKNYALVEVQIGYSLSVKIETIN